MQKISTLLLSLTILLLIPLATYAIDCGEEITADSVLDDDLICQSTAIIIEEDDITFDCNNNDLNGSGLGNGIIVRATNIRIKSCGINHFTNGILLSDSYDVQIDDSSFKNNNLASISIENSEDLLIKNNEFVKSNYAILYKNTTELVQEDNDFSEITIGQTQELVPQQPTTPETPRPPTPEQPNTTPPNTTENNTPSTPLPPQPNTTPQETPPQPPAPLPLAEQNLPDDELYKKSFQLHYDLEDDDPEINERLEKLKETLKHVTITREFSYEDGKTKVSITIEPKDSFFKKTNLEDVSFYSLIPKCFANLADDILLEPTPPNTVLEEDPLIVWQFSQGVNKKQTFDYHVPKQISKKCEELFRDFIVAEEVNTSLNWVPLLIIPLIVIIIVFFSGFVKSKPEEPTQPQQQFYNSYER